MSRILYFDDTNGNTIIEADKFYPSSKTCSCCGAIKSDLKLGDRVYKCKACESVLDRDYNASLNLAINNLTTSKVVSFSSRSDSELETEIQPLEKLRV